MILYDIHFHIIIIIIIPDRAPTRCGPRTMGNVSDDDDFCFVSSPDAAYCLAFSGTAPPPWSCRRPPPCTTRVHYSYNINKTLYACYGRMRLVCVITRVRNIVTRFIVYHTSWRKGSAVKGTRPRALLFIRIFPF